MLFGEREDESEELEKLEEIPADNSQHISVDTIFASSIEKVNKNENDLRNSFRKQIISTSSGIASKETNGIHRAVAEATEALTEIKDIRGELNMIRSVVRTQQRVWDQLFNRSSGRDENPENPQNINSWKSTDPSYVLSRIQSLLEFAEETERNVESVLDLRMNQLNLNEAENSRKQGETIMVFTVVTVIFVPLSFLTSLFALNISVFPHAGDNVLYQPGLVFGSLCKCLYKAQTDEVIRPNPALN
ncbi:putative Mg2+ transporter -like Zinc transport protein [Rosellinia necatrix]|uniref:Putative Mg2+ transporter-like Zinc transport protein n=1 Tax=Rosellinia necatrix TaxID=77044 RepID=A0A1S8A7J8_ROSNE|nr:putative Mg2+ transporter -like Zinc transport protein [Rosellinia necatrix]